MTKNNEKGRQEDKHGDKNKEKWVTFTYYGKEVKYTTKLFKGTNVKMSK
jgi:hypothetical protein